jgi:pimeloyl-ACP methyl ester carboxylesterase
VSEFRNPRAVTDRKSFQEHVSALAPAYFADFRKTTKRLGRPPELTISVYDEARSETTLPTPEWDVRGKLAGIDVPALVLVGTYDFICSPSWARRMHAGIPESWLVEFTRSGHFPHLEQPKAFARSIRKFIRERVPRTAQRRARATGH